MLPSVDLPAPFGPMIACTSPGFTASVTPLRMSLPATRAWRLSIFSMVFSGARSAPAKFFEAQPQLRGAVAGEPGHRAVVQQGIHRAVVDARVLAVGHRQLRGHLGVAER